MIAIILGICLAGTVIAAAAAVLDRNSDGIVNVWDAQAAAQDQTLGETEKAELLAAIQEDVMKEVAVTKIRSADDLRSMQANGNYQLAADIDLSGAAWTPVENFSGVLDGNGYTISNVVLNEAVQSGNQGFFGDIAAGGSVERLNLRNVTLTVSGDAQNAGMLAGVNNGAIRGCTVTGTITAGSSTASIGIAAGQNSGIVEAGSFTVNAGENDHYGAEVTAEIRHDRKSLRLVGSGNDAEGTALWRDCSVSTADLPDTLQQRRRTAVGHMYAMASVKWSPAQDMMEYRCYYNRYSTPSFAPTQTYTGIPYSHGSCSLERFTYALLEDGAAVNGTTTVTRKGMFLDPMSVYLASDLVEELQGRHDYEDDGTYYWRNEQRLAMIREALAGVKHETIDWGDPEKGGITGQTMAGYGRWIGNDCSSSVMYAWWRAANADVANGGVAVMQASLMRPTTARTIPAEEGGKETVIADSAAAYGILPLDHFYYDQTAKTPDADRFAQAYAMAGMADAVANDDHVRMLACDPVVIRNAEGTIDIDRSYIITIEHGGVSNGNVSSGCGWGTYCKYSFQNLIDNGYYPATIGAWNDVDSSAAAENNSVEMDGTVICSNAHIISVQIGNTVFYTGVEQARFGDEEAGTHGFRDVCTSVDLSKEAEFSGLQDPAAQTITVTLADGSVWTGTGGTFTKQAAASGT